MSKLSKYRSTPLKRNQSQQTIADAPKIGGASHYPMIRRWFMAQHHDRMLKWASESIAQQASVLMFLRSVQYYDADTIFSKEDVERAYRLEEQVRSIQILKEDLSLPESVQTLLDERKKNNSS